MSTSVSRRSSATAHPTRQQLDELDALLKRMLDLPVERAGDEVEGPAIASEPASGRREPADLAHQPAHAGRSPTSVEAPVVNYSTDVQEADLKPRVVSDAPEGKPEDWTPLTSTWQPSARTWKPLTDAWKQAQAAAGKPAEPSLAIEEAPVAHAPGSPAAPQQMEAPPAVAAAPAPHAPASPSLPFLKELPLVTVSHGPALWPLVLFNKAFDICLTPWGAPGRWLRGYAGRMLLGAVGLACLAAAVVLAAAPWFGWTW